jgi:hypothetical protein
VLTSHRLRSVRSGARSRSEGCGRATTGRRALEGNQKPMEGKNPGSLVATRVQGSVSHTEEDLEVGSVGCSAQAERSDGTKRRGGRRRGDASVLCGGGVLRRVHAHRGERHCTSLCVYPAASATGRRCDIHRSSRAASSEVVSAGCEVQRAHREGGGSERSPKDRCTARGSGNGISGGRCRAKVREGLRASSKRCESCPAGVQHSPNGAGARTAEVVRNHAGGSRLAARGGGRSSVTRGSG